jgi:uncharacterized membrane protein YkvI
MPRFLRPALSMGLMLLSVHAASAVGRVALIARGYGILTHAFIALLIVSVLTIGLWRVYSPPTEWAPAWNPDSGLEQGDGAVIRGMQETAP